MEHKLVHFGTLTLIFLALFTACDEKWEEHYDAMPETIDKNMWEVIQENPELSSFVQHMLEMNYDTLFLSNNTYTVFVPDNEAFISFIDTGEVSHSILDYHISRHFIQSGSIQGKRKIQTFAEKYALFDNGNNGLFFDGIPLEYESPLYQNGKYFILNQVGYPRPNIYEFFSVNNPIFKDYIDSQDSIILDREESRPIGFDENGNTIYDTVSIIYNEFEELFFPIREEFRNKTATVVFPLESDYNEALNEMVAEMGGIYNNYKDVPLEWQNEVLIPYLLEHGVFEGMLEEIDFLTPTYGDTIKLKNVLGDSVIIDYEVSEKTICSNGFVYNYSDFKVADTLYNGSILFETESLLKETGIDRYAWKEEVKVTSDIAFEPKRELVQNASNDSIMRVLFPAGYDGNYTLEFTVENLFPRKYLMVVRTHMNTGGIYEIYVDNELVKTFDYYDYALAYYQVIYSVTGERYVPKGGFNRFDCWIETKSDYGKTKIKFVYKEPGQVSANGLVIDYINFVPHDF